MLLKFLIHAVSESNNKKNQQIAVSFLSEFWAQQSSEFFNNIQNIVCKNPW